MGFKVIVVGGGPVGLVAAHGLHNAGIDFVLLERRDAIVDYSGASIVLAPASMRILSQFGLREKLEDAGAELSHVKSFTRDGYKFKDSTQVTLLKECLGAAQVIFHRPELVQILLDGLAPSARAKIHTQKQVTSVEQDEDGCTVSCTDGTTYQGAVVIGADGVYSQTRRQLRQAMLRAGRQPDDCDEEQPYECAYRMMWCTFPRPQITPAGLGGETQDTHRTLAYMAGKKVSAILCYEKLPEPTRQKVTYTKADVDEFARSFYEWPVSETILFKEVYNSPSAGMANLGEGVVKNFSYGRVVLVGDAAHRFTPNAGLGFNNGIQDIVSVCNGVHAAVQKADGESPSRETLEATFKQYFEQRITVIKKDLRGSAVLTRLQAWANTWFWVLSRFLLVPDWFQRLTIRKIAVPNMRLAPVFRYIQLPSGEPYVGTTAWANPIPLLKEKQG